MADQASKTWSTTSILMGLAVGTLGFAVGAYVLHRRQRKKRLQGATHVFTSSRRAIEVMTSHLDELWSELTTDSDGMFSHFTPQAAE